MGRDVPRSTRGAERRAAFVGITGFGASAPAGELYRHFATTPEAVAEAALALI